MGDYIGEDYGVFQGDTRSLDYGSCAGLQGKTPGEYHAIRVDPEGNRFGVPGLGFVFRLPGPGQPLKLGCCHLLDCC